jgi:hypothetical protein
VPYPPARPEDHVEMRGHAGEEKRQDRPVNRLFLNCHGAGGLAVRRRLRRKLQDITPAESTNSDVGRANAPKLGLIRRM